MSEHHLRRLEMILPHQGWVAHHDLHHLIDQVELQYKTEVYSHLHQLEVMLHLSFQGMIHHQYHLQMPAEGHLHEQGPHHLHLVDRVLHHQHQVELEDLHHLHQQENL